MALIHQLFRFGGMKRGDLRVAALFSSPRPAFPRTIPSMDVADLLSPESIVVFLEGETKEAIVRELVDALVLGEGDTDREAILTAVLERESVMSTGIGRGIAVPHARTVAVTGVRAAIGIAREPVSFDAVDGKPVKTFILIVADPDAADDHLRALSWISGILNRTEQQKALENASSVPEVLAALRG